MEQSQTRSRIWEIDAVRGLCIPGMILIHLIYDLVDLYALMDWSYPHWYILFKNNYGALFVLISGLSVTLGSRSVRRGAEIFSMGMVITLVTAVLYRMGLADRGILIYFGVLHCLGVCMMLWPGLRWLDGRNLVLLGLCLAVAGWWLRGELFESGALTALGLMPRGFRSADYFPLMPNLGYFLLGAAAGRTLYREKRTRFPRVNADSPVLRLLSGMGRHSLMIYLLHQPVLALMCQVFSIWKAGIM